MQLNPLKEIQTFKISTTLNPQKRKNSCVEDSKRPQTYKEKEKTKRDQCSMLTLGRDEGGERDTSLARGRGSIREKPCWMRREREREISLVEEERMAGVC